MTARIPLHSTKYPGLFAVVDDDDAERVLKYRWHPRLDHGVFYAWASTSRIKGHRTNVAMHRVVLGLSKSDPEVDHEDGDGLNNCRKNLRKCSHSQNLANSLKRAGSSSVFRGVKKQARNNRWQAYVSANGRYFHIGCFTTEIDAAIARDAAARIHHGPFGRYNFPLPGERGIGVTNGNS